MSKFFNVYKVLKFGTRISGSEARDKILNNELSTNINLVAIVSNNLGHVAWDVSDKEEFVNVNSCFLNGYFTSLQIYEVDQRILGDNFFFEESVMQAKL